MPIIPRRPEGAPAAGDAAECNLLKPGPATLAGFPRDLATNSGFQANRRRYARVPLDLECDLELPGNARLSGRTRDVSLKGVFLRSADGLPVGAPCTATLFFEGRRSELCIEVRGRINRSEPGGMGIEFLSMGMESLDHLKRLVRGGVSTPDPVGQSVLREALYPERNAA